MKIKNLLLSALLLLSFSVANTQESGIRDVKPFFQLSVFGNIDVELIKGEKESVEIFPGNFEIEDIVTENDGTELKVKLTSKILNKESTIRIVITYIDLKMITATGGADLWSKDTIKIDKLWLDAASGGTINLIVALNDLEAKVNSGSTISLEGKVNAIDVSAISGGIFSAFRLECKTAVAKANVGGKVKVLVTEKIEATATSAYIGYKGDPDKVIAKEKVGGTVVAVGEDEEE